MRYFSGVLFILIAALPYAPMLRDGMRSTPSRHTATESLTIVSPHRREVEQEYDRGFKEWLAAKHKRDS